MLRLLTILHTWLTTRGERRHRERGQATAEYALVLLGGAALAMLLVAWATETNRINTLLDSVFRHITGLVA